MKDGKRRKGHYKRTAESTTTTTTTTTAVFLCFQACSLLQSGIPCSSEAGDGDGDGDYYKNKSNELRTALECQHQTREQGLP